jgi:hypothetical protein
MKSEKVLNITQQRAVSTSVKPHQRAARQNGRPAAANVDSVWTHTPTGNLAPSDARRGPRGPGERGPARGNRGERIYNAIQGSASSPALHNQFNIVSPPKPAPAMSIRGLAGPYTVIAKNFAPGTTAADIESATTPIGGVAISCRILSELPSVMAELIFETKEGADNVVQTFNNQNVSIVVFLSTLDLTYSTQADGNLLLVYHKVGGAAPSIPQAAPIAPNRAVTPLGPRAAAPQRSYSSERYNRERSRERSKREYVARAEVVDGSYGFDDRMDTDDRDGGGRGGALYSDSLASNRGRGRDNGRDRGRGNNRGSHYYN